MYFAIGLISAYIFNTKLLFKSGTETPQTIANETTVNSLRYVYPKTKTYNFINEEIDLSKIDYKIVKREHDYNVLQVLKNMDVSLNTKMDMISKEQAENSVYTSYNSIAILFTDW